MDYHSLKRKELQALCKEHNIPANLANSVLADKLSALLNEKPKPKTRQRACIKSPVETTDEGEPEELRRQAKKVRFSANHDLVEYELRPGEKQKEVVAQTKTRRKSVGKKVNDSVDDNNITVELKDGSEQIPIKVTRSRGQSSVKEVVTNNEKKKAKRGANDVEKETVVDKETEVNVGKVTRSKSKDGGVQHEENKQRKRVVKEGKEETKTVEETVVGRARVTRSKAQTLTECGTVSDANPKKKSGKQVLEGGTVNDANPKKKNGKQVKTEEQNVEPSNVPVRAIRSRRQTIKEDDENTVTNNIQTDKKRTRREMKATDSITNSIHVADKHEPPKRKSLRTSGTETVVEDESDKKEVVNKSRVTRSKAPLANETSGRNKNKTSKVEIQVPVEPLKHEVKNNVNRRKSVLQPEKIEVAVNQPTRRNTRRKSVVQKAIKTIESPTVGKKQSKGLSDHIEDKENVSRLGKDAAETVYEEVTTETPRSLKQRGTPIKEDRTIESPKSSTRNASRSEGKSVADTSKSRKRRGVPVIEDLIIEKSPESSTRNASRSEGKSVGETSKSRKRRGAPVIEDPIIEKSPESSTRSASKSEGKSVAVTPKSRKRRGAPIIEDLIIEKSPKKSTRSASKSEAKSVAKNPVESSLKKPMSKGGSSAISGAIINDSSKKKAKFSETKQTDSEHHTVNSSKEWTPVAKMKNLKLDEVSESEVIPATDKSGRRFTRSTFKEQPVAEAQLFSPKVANFRHDPAVNTAPGRITRRGPKHDGNAAGIFSEKVGKKKQTRQSAHKKSLDDAEVASSKVAVAGPTLDVGTIGVQSEVKQPDAQVQMSSPEVAEVGVNPDVDTVGVQSEIEQTYDDVQMSSHEVAEVLPNSDGDTIGVANSDGDTIGAEYEISKEVTGQTLGDLSASESSRLPNIAVEENIVPVEENASLEVIEDAVACNEKSVTENLFCEKQRIPESQSLDAGTKLGENLSHTKMTPVPMADVAETVPAQNQNEDIYVESGLVTETDDTPSGKNLSVTEVSPVPLADVAETVPAQNQNEEAYVESGLFTEAVEATSGKNLSDTEVSPVPMADVDETVPAPNQNEEAYVESGLFTETVNLETSGLKPERPDDREKEMDSMESGSTLKGMQINVMIEDPLVSVGQTVVVEEAVDNNHDPSLQISSDEHDVDEDANASTQKTSMSEPDSGDRVDVPENLFSGNGGGECDNVVLNRMSHLDKVATPMIGKDDVQDDDMNVPQELETGSELPNAKKDVDIDIERVLDDHSDVQDGESEHNQSANSDSLSEPNQLASDDGLAIDVDVEDDSSVPAQNENVHGHVQDGEFEHNQSANSDSLSEPNQLASNDSLAVGVDVEDDNSMPVQNENVPVADEVLVKSCEQEADVPCDMIRQSDLVTSKDAPDGDTFVRVDALNESVVDKNNDLVSSMLSDTEDMEDEGDDGNKQNLFEFDVGFQPKESKGISSDMRIEQTKEEVETGRGNDLMLDDKKAETIHEDPTREEASPISYTKGESTIDDIKSSQRMGDVGAHESQIIQESSPIAYKKEEFHVDVTESETPIIKEDGINKQGEPRSAGTSVDWGDYVLTMDGLEEPGSANRGADVEGKGKTDVQDSYFQASARTSSIEESSGLAACLPSSVRKLEKDPRNANDGNSNQEVDILKESVNSEDMTEDFNWPDSSLKSLFTTPGTSKTSHINDSKTGAGNSTFPDSSRGNEDIGSSGTAAHQFNHQWDNSPSKDIDGDDLSKFFEDDVDGTFDRSESNTYIKSKQLDFSNEAAETSHHDDPSDLKNNSTGLFDKEVTQLKGSIADDDLAFDTGHT